MFYFLSKFLPPFIYPVGLACILLITALWMQQRPRWQTRLIILTIVLLWAGSNRIVAMALIHSLERQFAPAPTSELTIPQAEAIVVLGGGTQHQAFPRPIPELNDAGDRLLYAAWLYKQGAAPKILVSGGKPALTGPAPTSGAESMAAVLGIMGIPSEAIILESASRNTYENAVETQAVLENHAISNIILVTSAWHMPRAYRMFARTTLNVTPAPTDFRVSQEDWKYYTRPDLMIQLFNLLPKASNLALTTKALKEYVGLVVYGLQDWL